MSNTYELSDEYYECSIASPNETADDLPGHGRLLGNVYVFLGRHLEHGVGMVAGKMELECKAEKGLGISVIMVELYAIEGECPRSHTIPPSFGGAQACRASCEAAHC